jgi:hypothetical protein
MSEIKIKYGTNEIWWHDVSTLNANLHEEGELCATMNDEAHIVLKTYGSYNAANNARTAILAEIDRIIQEEGGTGIIVIDDF